MKQKIIFFLFLLMATLSTHAQKTQYNIKDFGAVGDGVTLCTDAINSAIATCSANGGGTVVVPVGVYKSGMILMQNNVELHLEIGSTLLASTDYKDFQIQPKAEYRALRDDPEGWLALIYAEKKNNFAITGFGTIDGNGALQKPAVDKGLTQEGRRHNILFISCKQIRIEGIRMFNSGMWNQHYLDCEDVIVDRIEVYNHSNKNNDAIDIDGCRRFVLSNSILDSDDDGITLKSTGMSITENVTVTNCIVSSNCNAIKAGTESTGGFRNITISNCVIKPTRSTAPPIYGLPNGTSGISLEIVDGGIMEGIAISNITIEGVNSPLYIRLANRARKHNESASEPPVGKMRNISIQNIVAHNTGNFSSSITSIPGHYIENVTIDNIQLFNKGGISAGQYKATHQDVPEDEKEYPDAYRWGHLPSSVFFIRHVKGLSINNLMFGSNQTDPRIPIIAVDVERVRIGKSIFSGQTLPPAFVLLHNAKEYDIEKPLGWGNTPVIKE